HHLHHSPSLLRFPTPLRSPRFPYTTLFRSAPRDPGACMLICETDTQGTIGGGNLEWQAVGAARALLAADVSHPPVRVQNLTRGPDRKSTRLNSSHLGISYAVFCLKKKKKTT